MTDRYQVYEAQCERPRTTNQKLLADFETWLAHRGASQRTIRQHTSNLDLYLNHYLLYEDTIEAARGVFMWACSSTTGIHAKCHAPANRHSGVSPRV
jgi:hypothetical protein